MKKLLFILSLFCAFQWMSAKEGDSCTMQTGVPGVMKNGVCVLADASMF